MQSLTLTGHELFDVECLLLGAYRPLKGPLRESDYLSVLKNMRLSTGELWPIPITISLSSTQKEHLYNSKTVQLKDPQGIPIAVLTNIEIYKAEPHNEVLSVFGSDDDNHPFIKHLLRKEDYWYLGGDIDHSQCQLPPHYDYLDYRLSADSCKSKIAALGWKTVVGFQTRNPMHRSHYHLTRYAMEMAGHDSRLLLTPAVGPTQTCDVDYSTRVKGYIALLDQYPAESAALVLLPLAMRMAGPREALLHSLVRANYGCTHFVVGRDHAGPSYKKKDGASFYTPYQAQELLGSVADELPIKIITSVQIVYVKELEEYRQVDNVPKDMTIMNISGTEQRAMLERGEELPDWYTFPTVSSGLRERYPPTNKQGFCIYFVGLSGAGKSTLAHYLQQRIGERTSRRITLLDGDIVRMNLSKGLGFTKEDRSINVRRVGWVAHEIVKHGGIVICSTIAPYQEDRDYNRKIISRWGGYLEVWVDTPLAECEKRDVKGLYKLARTGQISNFTGISDPFEKPSSDITLTALDMSDMTSNLDAIISHLEPYLL